MWPMLADSSCSGVAQMNSPEPPGTVPVEHKVDTCRLSVREIQRHTRTGSVSERNDPNRVGSIGVDESVG
jgi:hypothetical protein